MKTRKILILLSLSILIVGCGNSLERAKRTVSLIQDNVTLIIGNISEIQNREFDLQQDFEATINLSEDLSGFGQSDNPLNKNIEKRKELLAEMEESRQQLLELCQELEEIPENDQLPKDQITKVIEYTTNLCDKTDIYISNYLENIETEDQSYKSITSEEIDHETFFAVFDNVNLLYTENNMNLDHILEYFEPLNTLLVNLKVYLVNITGE
ncbi:YkyA family protein [Facklamia sp. 7083-14-GEN3]|uniref:YkyA family protein n=1 Tax=Facklamia sp. 7083-14-GEN3 TaxID=2973478 RepID=UPI00215BEA7E|nr:YkyA family protein [Facklamia sp. 7083-14-GEN3]MCR8968856.1 YkyA family protein [Facklamia sp. 7083-14-GEN3]